jgi:hypothetical protein
MHGNTKNHRVGEGHPSNRFTVEDVYDIRRRGAAGENQRQMAREYAVTPSAINAIIKRKTWTHLPELD